MEKSSLATAQRLKQVRRELNLSQSIFGRPLGLRQGKISALEKQDRLTQVLAIAIEHIYGVREVWLRTGKGPKYTENGPHLYAGSEDLMFDALLAKRPDVAEAVRAILGTPTPIPEKKKRTRKAR